MIIGIFSLKTSRFNLNPKKERFYETVRLQIFVVTVLQNQAEKVQILYSSEFETIVGQLGKQGQAQFAWLCFWLYVSIWVRR